MTTVFLPSKDIPAPQPVDPASFANALATGFQVGQGIRRRNALAEFGPQAFSSNAKVRRNALANISRQGFPETAIDLDAAQREGEQLALNVRKQERADAKARAESLLGIVDQIMAQPNEQARRGLYGAALDDLAEQGVDISQFPAPDDPNLDQFLQLQQGRLRGVAGQLGTAARSPAAAARDRAVQQASGSVLSGTEPGATSRGFRQVSDTSVSGGAGSPVSDPVAGGGRNATNAPLDSGTGSASADVATSDSEESQIVGFRATGPAAVGGGEFQGLEPRRRDSSRAEPEVVPEGQPGADSGAASDGLLDEDRVFRDLRVFVARGGNLSEAQERMRDLGLVPGQFGPAPDPRLYDEIRTKVRDDGLIEVIGVRDGKEIRLGAFGKRQPVNTAALRLQNLASDSVFRDLLPEPPAEVPDEAAEVSEEDEMAEFLDSLDRDNALRIRERQLIQSLSDLEILVRRGDDLARVIANTVVNDVVSDFSRGSVSINASDISAALSTVFGDRTLEENRARERIRDETIPLEIEAVGRVIGKLLADSLKLLLMALPVGRALQLLRILPRIVRR